MLHKMIAEKKTGIMVWAGNIEQFLSKLIFLEGKSKNKRFINETRSNAIYATKH